ncbi:hypothetical protein C8F04DRAFT_1082387 [Mycena alexandri]|uniref:DUF6533 domain-containing protein n=1 Tax=Mycena alexandri TaxID=1745969 RepID=A0AAD6T7G5_9AGAR|nr:hypothetical protein C8F04DRAFT_1082387 [Mycena alexandri]
MSGAFAELVQVLEDLTIMRFVSAAGLVILLYDHVLSFPQEVRYIWSAQHTSGKWAFLILRYGVPPMMIGHTIQLSGLSEVTLSDKVGPFCKGWYTAGIILGWVTIAINNSLVLLRLWVLWDRHRIFIVCTFLVFFATEMATLILACIGFVYILPGLTFEPILHICVFTTPSTLRVVWIPAVIFQSMTLTAMGWKVLRHPQTFKPLRRDGFLYYWLLWVLDVTNCIVFLVARTSLTFVTTFFLWCFTTTTTCRLILGIRRSSERARSEAEGGTNPSDTYEEDDYADSVIHGWQPSPIELGIHAESSSTVRGR